MQLEFSIRSYGSWNILRCSRLLFLFLLNKCLTLLEVLLFNLIPLLQVLTKDLLFNSVIDLRINSIEKEAEFFSCLLNIYRSIYVLFLWVNNFFNFIYDPGRYSFWIFRFWCRVFLLLLIILVNFIFSCINLISSVTILIIIIIEPIEIVVTFFILIIIYLFLTCNDFYWEYELFLFACWII